MANANYTLSVGPLIDTIFVLEIGGQFADVDQLTGTLQDVHLSKGEIQIRIELGGSTGASWDLKVEVEDGDDEFSTIPPLIKGKINQSGGSKFDRSCPLQKKHNQS